MPEISTVIMGHDGQTLEKLLLELGVKKGVLADRIKKNQNTITRLLKRETISSEYLIDIGKALRFDLTHKFPRLKKIPEASQLHYFNENPDELLHKVEEIESGYKSAKQETADLQQEVKFLKNEIDNLKEIIEAKNKIIEMQNESIQNLKKSQS